MNRKMKQTKTFFLSCITLVASLIITGCASKPALIDLGSGNPSVAITQESWTPPATAFDDSFGIGDVIVEEVETGGKMTHDGMMMNESEMKMDSSDQSGHGGHQ